VTARQNIICGGFAILLFFGALLWAKGQDPFYRKWFTLETADHSSVKCVAILPKPMRRYPVVIYANGKQSAGSLLNDGNDLRQMAELGLATISWEYNQANETAFAAQFEALLRHLDRQTWVNTNAVAWVGFESGANWMLDFALRHPEQQPQLLVQLGGAGLPTGQTNSHLKLLHCPVLLVHGDQDEVFPLTDTKRLASALQAKGLPVELKIIPGTSHGMEPERGLVFRCIGEYCRSHLAGKDAWQNYHSLAQWQADISPLWLFWLPAAIWVVGWVIRSRCRKVSTKVQLNHCEIALRCLAVLLAIWALAVTAIHWVTPRLGIGDRTLAIARRVLVQPKERADFEYLTAQPIWREHRLKTLLEHVELAGYTRKSVNWQLDDKMYRDFVLSPVITGNAGEQLNWRRPMWEEFCPLIRYESSLEYAASIVVRHLRERVTIATGPNLPREVPTICLRQITDQAGFEVIYVAALRSVGVPARLDAHHQAEFWDSAKWCTAPRPCVAGW
jgi:predicted esterase